MALYDGDNTYNRKALFRGGIMNSGSIVPVDTVDCPKGQGVYDTVVKNAGCASQVILWSVCEASTTRLTSTLRIPFLRSWAIILQLYLTYLDLTGPLSRTLLKFWLNKVNMRKSPLSLATKKMRVPVDLRRVVSVA